MRGLRSLDEFLSAGYQDNGMRLSACALIAARSLLAAP
jgi:hypothetical protein